MNKDLLIEGKDYISAPRAAKKIGYAGDYIGQLCRDGKVEARMIGRTWYVNFESLLEHKRNFKAQKPKKNKKTKEEVIRHEYIKEEISPKVSEKLPEATLFKSTIKATISYERDEAPRLPELSKVGLVFPKKGFLKNATAAFVSLFIIANVAFSWMAFVSPDLADRAYMRIADAFDAAEKTERQTSGTLTTVLFPGVEIKNKINNSLVAETRAAGVAVALAGESVRNFFINLFGSKTVKSQTIPQSQGIVVVPENGSHDDAVSKIKNTFSDDVNVNFDTDGTSGVITPAFHTGDDSENYAFIIVPVKKTK